MNRSTITFWSRDREAREEDAQIIALHKAVEIDPSVLQLADLPPGTCFKSFWNGSAPATLFEGYVKATRGKTTKR
jgi:hypothetical protein